jgi:hypothetical protein
MSEKSGNPKHSVGKGAQSEHHNDTGEKSYVADPKKMRDKNREDEGKYLEQKWKKIAKDFQKSYNLDVNASEYKDESFSDTLKRLESTTGKSAAEWEKEIKNWN